MLLEAIAIKAATPTATPLISTVSEVVLKPKLLKFLRSKKADKELLAQAITERFAEYLNASYERHSHLTTVVFSNQRKLLRDLYIPLTLERTKDRKKTFVTVDDSLSDFPPVGEKILVQDDAGMGKSTLLKYLLLRSLERETGLPVFIELRLLRPEKPIIDVILDELRPIGGDLNLEQINSDLVLKLIESGDFIFFFDGYDEITEANKEKVSQDLRHFISKARRNRIIFSSREVPSLADFAEFERLKIKPLDKSEAYSLIRKYDPQDEVASRLIDEIEGHELKHVEEFLQNPLMVSLLFRAYDFKQVVPRRKDIFYRQVFNSLFEDHDATKAGGFIREKASGLNIEDFHRALRALGFFTIKAGVSYTRDDLVSYIRRAREECSDLSFKSADLLSDLLRTVPLFAQEGGIIRWKHKSLQEYFSAAFICYDAKKNQPDLLRAMADSHGGYLNVLGLCRDIDYKTYRNTILFDLISKFLHYYDHHFLKLLNQGFDESQIDYRRKLHAVYRVFIWPSYFRLDHPKELQLRKKLKLEHFGPIVHGGGFLLDAIEERKEIDLNITFYIPNSFVNIVNLVVNADNELFVRSHKEIDKTQDISAKNRIGALKKLKTAVTKIGTDFWDSHDYIEVTDDPKSPVNTPELFALITEVLALECKHVWLLDVGYCRPLHQEIEQELTKQADKDIYLQAI